MPPNPKRPLHNQRTEVLPSMPTGEHLPPPPPKPPAPPTGDDFHEINFYPRGYRIIADLGEGSYGRVYKALDERAGIEVAIKRFHSDNRAEFETLRREIQLLARAEGALGVIGLKEIHLEDEPFYFVMQFAQGGSLADVISNGDQEGPRLPVTQCVAIFERIVRTMDYVHRRGIVHCDLKPANILLNGMGEPLVADFGQAGFTAEDRKALGTLFFMAPEQAREKAVAPDPRWDIFSLGAILYCMITGQPPRQDNNLSEEINQVRRQHGLAEALKLYRRRMKEAPKPTDHWRFIDRRLAEIVDLCLEYDIHKRIQNTEQILDLLKRREVWLQQRYIWVQVSSQIPLKKEEPTSLEECLLKGPLPVEESVSIFKQVVQSVHRMHIQGIRHRDIRPSTIYLSGPEMPTIESINLMVESTVQKHPLVESSRTEVSFVDLSFDRESIYYTAPEQATLERESSSITTLLSQVSPGQSDIALSARKYRPDVYSLGALLYTMLTGKPPRKHPDLEDQLSRAQGVEAQYRIYRQEFDKCPEPIEHQAHPQVDPDLKLLVNRCLAKGIEDRPQSTKTILDALDRRQRWLQNRGSFYQLVRMKFSVLIGMAIIVLISGSFLVERSRTQHNQQTLDANEQFGRTAQQILTEKLDERIRDLQAKAKKCDELIDDILLVQKNFQNRTTDPKAPKQVIEDSMRTKFEDWLRRQFPDPRMLKPPDYAPLSLLVVVEDGNRFRGYYLASMRELSPGQSTGDLFRLDPATDDELSPHNWSWRDYFHGQGHDLKENELPNRTIQELHISSTYQSKLPGNPWLIEIAIPIQDAKKKVIAILMTRLLVRPANGGERFGLADWFQDTQKSDRQLILMNRKGQIVRHVGIQQPIAEPIYQEWIDGKLEGVSSEKEISGQEENFIDLAQPDKPSCLAFYHSFRPYREIADHSKKDERWMLVVLTKQAVTEKPVNELRNWFLLVGFSVLVVYITTSFYVIRKVYDQMRYGPRLR